MGRTERVGASRGGGGERCAGRELEGILGIFVGGKTRLEGLEEGHDAEGRPAERGVVLRRDEEARLALEQLHCGTGADARSKHRAIIS